MFDIVSIIKTAGYFGVTGIIFAESGLLIGFFLPGDSLLFTAGVLASAGFLNIWVLIPLVFLAAVIGDNVGYYIGNKAGEALFEREDTIFFKRSHLKKAKVFFDTHGRRSVILARFIPVVRTFVPVLAGIGKMPHQNFFFSNIIGGACWSVGLPLLGFGLGASIPDIDHYLLPIILMIVFVSFIPVIKMWFSTK